MMLILNGYWALRYCTRMVLLYQNGFIFEYYTIKFTNNEFYIHGPENSLKELLRNSSLQQSRWKLDSRDQEHMV